MGGVSLICHRSYIKRNIWVWPWGWDCLVSWFCHQLIPKPGNKSHTFMVWSKLHYCALCMYLNNHGKLDFNNISLGNPLKLSKPTAASCNMNHLRTFTFTHSSFTRKSPVSLWKWIYYVFLDVMGANELRNQTAHKTEFWRSFNERKMSTYPAPHFQMQQMNVQIWT